MMTKHRAIDPCVFFEKERICLFVFMGLDSPGWGISSCSRASDNRTCGGSIEQSIPPGRGSYAGAEGKLLEDRSP